MLQHQTTIELTAEPTHDGTNEIIASIIDKLGELTHGCAIITGCKMTIDWVVGGTYQTRLEHADIHHTAIDPDGEKKLENLRIQTTKWIEEYIECRGAGIVFHADVSEVIRSLMVQVALDTGKDGCPGWIKDPSSTPDTPAEFNWFCNGLNLKYRLLPSKFEGKDCFEFVDITKQEDQ